jgi:hypothetical protein
LCRVRPQHADDVVIREASDESLASRSPREDIGSRRPGEGVPGDGLHRPSVDEAEGAEAQRGPRSQCDPTAVHPIHWSSSRHTMCPYLVRQLSRFSTTSSKFVSIVRRLGWLVRETTGFRLVRTSEE